MNIDFEKYFTLEDYKTLNPDLKFTKDDEYLEHWNSIGKNELRLFNKYLLDLHCEFGHEPTFYIPYYNYLIANNLFDSSLEIKTYIGMEPFYCFIKDKVKITFEKKTRIPEYFVHFVFKNLDKFHDEKKFIMLNDYKKYYSKYNIFPFKKPLLIIVNKFALNNSIINLYFSSNVISSLVELLKDKYQIIYMQSPPFKKTGDYITDEGEYEVTNKNTDDEYFFSEEGLNKFKQKHKEIIIYTDIFPEFGYNDFQLKLFSKCDNYICHPGGLSQIICLYFAEKIFVWDDDTTKSFANNSLNLKEKIYFTNDQMHNVDFCVQSCRKLFLEMND